MLSHGGRTTQADVQKGPPRCLDLWIPRPREWFSRSLADLRMRNRYSDDGSQLCQEPAFTCSLGYLHIGECLSAAHSPRGSQRRNAYLS